MTVYAEKVTVLGSKTINDNLYNGLDWVGRQIVRGPL